MVVLFSHEEYDVLRVGWGFPGWGEFKNKMLEQQDLENLWIMAHVSESESH
jgi:hypothetical protein